MRLTRLSWNLILSTSLQAPTQSQCTVAPPEDEMACNCMRRLLFATTRRCHLQISFSHAMSGSKESFEWEHLRVDVILRTLAIEATLPDFCEPAATTEQSAEHEKRKFLSSLQLVSTLDLRYLRRTNFSIRLQRFAVFEFTTRESVLYWNLLQAEARRVKRQHVNGPSCSKLLFAFRLLSSPREWWENWIFLCKRHSHDWVDVATFFFAFFFLFKAKIREQKLNFPPKWAYLDLHKFFPWQFD